MIIFGYFILEVLNPVVTAEPFVNVGVLVQFIMSEVSPGATELITLTIKVLSINKADVNKILIVPSL